MTDVKESASRAPRIKKVEKPSAAALGVTSDTDARGRVSNTHYVEDGGFVNLPFTEPGLPTPVKNIYTIKALSPDGVLVQLPLADQINNNVASPEDFVGLRVYQRKGFQLLFDLDTATGIYCPLWDCWARWSHQYRGACSPTHESQLFHQNDNAGKFSEGATTSRQWLGR